MSTKLFQHEIRQASLQTLYAMTVNPELLIEDAAGFSLDYQDEGRQSVIPDYMRRLIEGVVAHTEALDAEISPYIKGAISFERLPLIEKLLLRLAVYEMHYEDQTPDVVAVNEAIELSKQFGDEKTARFVNGVLTNFVKTIE